MRSSIAPKLDLVSIKSSTYTKAKTVNKANLKINKELSDVEPWNPNSKRRAQLVIPSSGNLFKTIQGPLEKAHHIRINGIDKARRLRHVECLLQMTWRKSLLTSTCFMYQTAKTNKESTIRIVMGFYNRTICLKIISTFLLIKTFRN